jgi:hypothetical protein
MRAQTAETLACSLLVDRDRRISKIRDGAHYTKKAKHGKGRVPRRARLGDLRLDRPGAGAKKRRTVFGGVACRQH